jgi:malonyl-CoA/methylmalonyl-CoA synthetase
MGFLRSRSARVGLEYHDRHYTFAQLARRADSVCAELTARGVRPGDRLAIYLANRTEWIDIYLACLSLGAVVVPINVLYREREVAHILEDAQPAAVVAAGPVPGAGVTPIWDVSELSSYASRHSARHDPPGHEAPALRDHSPGHEASALHSGRGVAPTVRSVDHHARGDAPALIVYTSGTTGRPKGAVLTRNNLVANADNLVRCWQITEEDRLLLALPLFHVHGLGNGVHCWLRSGCRMRLETRFEHARAARWFLEFRPTVFFGVPTMYARMVEWPAAVGRQIVSIRIVDAEGRNVPPGQTGELQVKGPTVFAGYWRREAATRAAFVDGWFRTGDLAERAADGYVTLRGRATDLIISGGFNVYPLEIEEFLLEQPEISEAAVIGVPDERRGEVPVAFLVLREGASVSVTELELRCRTHLASFKVPRRFSIVDSLPRNALGKVQKHLLRV